MKKLRLLLLALLVAGIVYWLAGKVGGPPDPEYQGRRLSAILKELPPGYTLDSGRIPLFAAEEVQAIRQMGTNAIPYLLKELSVTDSALKLKFRDLASRQSFVSIRFNMAWYHQYRAADAFVVLGPIGEPAIPELAKLLHQAETFQHAMLALGGIGDQSVPILIQTLSQTNVSVRVSVAEALEAFPPTASAVVPILIQNLSDPEKDVRRSAAGALGTLHQEAALAVPALAKCLEDSDKGVRQRAIEALPKFGADAKPAIPDLLKARATSSGSMRDLIELVIQAIDPEAAARAGIR